MTEQGTVPANWSQSFPVIAEGTEAEQVERAEPYLRLQAEKDGAVGLTFTTSDEPLWWMGRELKPRERGLVIVTAHGYVEP